MFLNKFVPSAIIENLENTKYACIFQNCNLIKCMRN